MEGTTLAISKIRTDGGTQSRESIDDDVVAEYATRMTSGEKFPPIVVYHDGKDYWLADGFHRVGAGELCGQAVLNADIRQGTVRDAILYSVGANAQHGIRRTNADKRRAVLVLLNDEQWSRWSNNEIAAKCGVGAPLVSELRKSLTISSYSEPRTYTTRHGTTATMNTENIGRTPAAVAELPENDAAASEIGNYFPANHQQENNEMTSESMDDSAPVRVRTKTVNPSTVEKLRPIIEEVFEMTRKPSSQVSFIDLRNKVANLREAFLRAWPNT